MVEETDELTAVAPDEPTSRAARIQVLLAKKRTSLAVLRTGISVFTLPLSVTTVLIATSRYYDFAHNLHFLIPLLILCVFLSVLGFYLVFRSGRAIRRQDNDLKRLMSEWED